MSRLFREAAIVMILAAGAARSDAQPSVEAASLQAELEKAERLNQQAEKLYAEGKYQDAVAPAERTLAIREKALGPDHPDVAQSLNNLGVIYWTQGEYTKGTSPLTRALDIRQKTLGQYHLDIAESLNNLATLYRDQGAYTKAESLYMQALDIREKALGLDHPDVAQSLSNLALVYQDQGAYVRAESLYIRALAIREKVFGLDHLDVAQSLNSLALLYWDQRAYSKAEPLCVRALAIREKTLGHDHPHVATSLNNLALIYRSQGAYAKAELMFVRAMHISERLHGPNHPEVATIQNNLASLYRDQGLYTKAEPLYRRALDTREKTLGPSHPDVAACLNSLGVFYWVQGAYAKAESLLTRAAEIQERQLRSELTSLSESRKRALITLLQQDTDRVISLHSAAMPDRTSALDLALATVLRRKGRILDSLVDNERTLRRHLTPHLRAQLDELARERSEFVAQLYAPDGRRSGAHQAVLLTLRARMNELESVLSAASAEFKTQSGQITIAAIRARLPVGVALVEFVRYQRIDAQQPRHRQLQEMRYIAYVLTARGPLRWVALGEAAPIDAQIDVVLAAVRGNAPMATTRAALQRLDALVLAPIRAQLSGISHLILAPDSQLNLVPFEALVDSQGHYAIESYLISYVTTGRDLLRLAARRRPRSPGVIVADPAYGEVPPPGPGTLAFKSLPDARAEATDLQTYFATTPLTGEEATKARLAALTGPAILHIATHGFFAREVATSRPDPGMFREIARGFYIGDGSSPQAPSASSDDLADGLDRSGLALAGANRDPDGIVTAREIAGFDWWGTQLVVLAACDTGVGAASSGDGVYGLRRALVLAGAASQVVSLWAADDAATRALMREFYGNLARDFGRAEALRRAKLALLHQPTYEHPFYWATFIAAGDWRPLPKGFLAKPRSP